MLLVKRDILRYVQGVRAMRGMGRGLSNYHVVLCKVRLIGAWINRREVVVGGRRIKGKKLIEHQCREGYARSLQGKGEKKRDMEAYREEMRKVKRCIYQIKEKVNE